MGENNKKSFINEKILGRDMTFRRALKYLLVSLLCGLAFGAAVLLVILFGRKYVVSDGNTAEQTLNSSVSETMQAESETAVLVPETAQSSVIETETGMPETSQQISKEAESLPQESGSSVESTSGETGESSAAEESTAADQEALLALIDQHLMEKEPTVDDLAGLRMVQQEAIQTVSRYLTLVSSTISETTWFESTVETKNNYAGVIIGKSDKEIQILTVIAAATGENDLVVTFHDGSCQKAVVRKKDYREGLVVLAVSTAGLGSSLTESIEEIPVYDGETVCGQPILTAGAALGAVGSYDFGLVNYVSEILPVVDGSRNPLYTRSSSCPEKGTFLMTLSGQLIGIAGLLEDDPVAGNRFVMLKSMKGLLENMKKGSDTAYLGITGSDISFDMKTENIPEGMLVTKVEDGSPAETAGIKHGDIIVSIGPRQLKGLEDYCSFMRNLKPGETSDMVISRGERGTFQNIEIEITAAVR